MVGSAGETLTKLDLSEGGVVPDHVAAGEVGALTLQIFDDVAAHFAQFVGCVFEAVYMERALQMSVYVGVDSQDVGIQFTNVTDKTGCGCCFARSTFS